MMSYRQSCRQYLLVGQFYMSMLVQITIGKIRDHVHSSISSTIGLNGCNGLKSLCRTLADNIREGSKIFGGLRVNRCHVCREVRRGACRHNDLCRGGLTRLGQGIGNACQNWANSGGFHFSSERVSCEKMKTK